jgi:UDP-N-acetylglucosamine 2-epimerase
MGKKVDKIKVELHGDTFVQLFGNNKMSDLRQAIVHVEAGESKEAAWARHLFDNPLDVNAIVKIFIIPRQSQI